MEKKSYDFFNDHAFQNMCYLVFHENDAMPSISLNIAFQYFNITANKMKFPLSTACIENIFSPAFLEIPQDNLSSVDDSCSRTVKYGL